MQTSDLSKRLALAAALVVLTGCGGSSLSTGPSALPTTSQGVTLSGTVVGGVGAASLGDVSAFSNGTITVTVEGTPITTTVATDGSFTLRGLPEGQFTLIFTHDSVELGRLTFDEVMPNQELTVIVEVTEDDSIELVEERRNGIGHGDVELQGDIEEILGPDPSGDSRFVLDGTIVAVRPGTTAIRQGNKARSFGDLEAGQQVHVKAVWMEPEGADQPVLAHEVKIQAAEADDDDGEVGGKVTICHIPPGNPSKRKTKQVDPADVDGHLGHGDTLGPC